MNIATGSRARLLALTIAFRIGIPVLLAAAGGIGATLTRAGEVPAPPASQSQRYDDAMEALRAQRYAVAYGRFAALADEGHAPSAMLALALVTYPPSMHGANVWSAAPGQLRRWTELTLHEVRARGEFLSRYDRGE